MRRALASAGALAAILAVAVSASGAASPRIQIAQVDTSRYPIITATVIAPDSDKTAHPELTLSEDGKQQTITQSGGGSQAAIGLALDVSRSMAGKPLAAARQAAASFISKKRTNDLVGIYSFGHTASPVQSPDTDRDVLGAALSRVPLDTVEGTALYDSIIQASRELSTEPTLTRVLVVLTDGDDTTKTRLDDAVAIAKSSGVTVDAIAIGSTKPPAALTSIARQTGGTVFAADRSAQGITQVYSRIAAQIRNTYRLQYSSHGDGTVPIEVGLKGYTPASDNVDMAAPAAEIVAAGGSISQISKRSSTGLALAIVIGIVVLCAALMLMRQPREAVLARRLDRYTTAERTGVIARREAREGGMSLRNLLIRRGERSFGGSAYFKRIAGLLERANMPMRAAEFAAIQGGAALGAFLVVFVLGMGLIVALIGLVVGAIIPEFVVRRKANKRRGRFEDQLGDTLAAVASSLRAGQSFQQAMSTIALDGPDPMSGEFQRVETEIRLGRPPDEALQAMAERLGSKNFEFVVLAVNIQRQVGGSLSDILDMVSDTVRSRVQFARKVKALTAMGRASAYVLVGMPIVLFGVIWLMDRSYVRPLWAQGAGNIMVLMGAISMTLGGLVCRKIVNFKY